MGGCFGSNQTGLRIYSKQMEFIVRQHLFDAEIAALSRVQYPDPNISKAPTPDSANSASNNQRRFQEIQGRIMDGQRNLKESWGEGIKNLSYDEIQKAFPETYAARSTKYIPPQPDVPRAAGKYRHAYMLPVHRNTTPLEGINFGRKFLEEWASENGIKYKSRLSDWL